MQDNLDKDFLFEDINTVYDDDSDIIEPSSEFNEKSGKMSRSVSIYNSIEALGFNTFRFFKRLFIIIFKIIKFPIKRLFQITRFCVLYLIDFIKKVSRNIVTEGNYFFNDLKTVILILRENKQASKHQKEKSFKIIKRFFTLSKQKHKHFLRHTFNYLLPIFSFFVLLIVINIFSSLNFALDVTYNNVHIGYIESENVFKKAKDIIDERLEIGGQEYDFQVVSQPKYKISVVKLNELSDSNEICEQIIKNSDSGLTTACGIYVDDKFIGSVKNESDASSVFKSFISEYAKRNNINQNSPDVILDLYEKVSYIQGLYSEDTLLDSNELKLYLSNQNKSEVSKYTVKESDTPLSICQNNNLSLEQFYAINPGLNQDENIEQGISVNVIKSIPYINVTVSKTEVTTKTLKFETQKINTNSLYQGTVQTISNGENGEEKVTTLITYVNGVKISSKVVSSVVTKEPTAKKIYVGTKPIPSNVQIYSNSGGAFVWPVVGADYVTSGFGYRYIFGRTSFHRGIDISGSGASGKPVIASAAGTVEKITRSNTGYGYSVLIDHGNGVKTRYAHCQAGSITVSVGQQVFQGQMVAKLGNTGNSTGPHLHFEIIYNGSYTNPLNYLSK